MSNSWDDMRKAKEDSYFAKKEQEALERLALKKQAKQLLSPVTSEPMEHVTVHGVNLDRCPTSGGVWLDAGELEHLMKIAHDQGVADAGGSTGHENWFLSFVRTIAQPAKKAT